VNLNAKAKDAKAALDAYDGVVQKTTSSSGILARIAEFLGTTFDKFIRMLGYSGARLGATELGMGQVGFAVARLAAQLPGLAQLFTYAFPIFAGIAMIQMVGQLIDTMKEWADIEEKSAGEQAKWTREIEKSAEAVDKLRERIAGMGSPLAEEAEQLANVGHKTIDLSSTTELLNKRLEDTAKLSKDLKEWVGYGATESVHMFDTQAEKTARQLEHFNTRIANSVTTVGQLRPKLIEVTTEVGELQKQLEKVKREPIELTFIQKSLLPPGEDTGPGGAAAQAQHEKNVAIFKEMVDKEIGLQQYLSNAVQSADLERLAIAQSMRLKEIALSEASALSRISIAETQSKELLRINVLSMSEESARRITFERQKTSEALRAWSERKRIVEEQAAEDKKAGRGTDFGPAFRGLEEERNKIVNDGAKRRLEIEYSTNAATQAARMAFNDALIEGDEKVTVSYLKREQARLQVALTRADTPEKIEAALAPLVENTTRQYEKRLEVLKAQAEQLVKEKLPETAPLPATMFGAEAAPIGTIDFSKQIEAIQKQFPDLATEVYTQLLHMNAEIMTLNEARATQLQADHQRANDREREFYRQDLSNFKQAQNDKLIEEREYYQTSFIALQTGLSQHPAQWSKYYDSVKTLTEQSSANINAILNEEEARYREDAEKKIALNKGDVEATIITQNELNRALEEIHKRREQAHKQMLTRQLEAAKEAIKHEEEEMRRVSGKIADEFTSAFHELLTVHESVGAAAIKLGRNLELYIIDTGIKRVAQHYADALVRMLASHSWFVAQVLGIERAGEAAKEAIHTAGAAKKQALDTVSATKEITLSTTKVARETGMESGFITKKFEMNRASEAAQGTLETASVARHATAETAKAGATAASETEQTAAATTGSASRQNVGMMAHLKSIMSAAADAAAHAYKWMVKMFPPPAGQILGAAAAVATFAAVAAYRTFLSGEGGLILGSAAQGVATGGAQPILVHSGEVITDVASLQNLQSGASGSVTMAGVPTTQVSMLSPGAVVVPRSMAGGLASAAKGLTGTAPGVAPPSGLTEIPQRLPSSMTGMIQNIIATRNAEGGFVFSAVSGMAPHVGYAISSEGLHLPTAAGGLSLPAAHLSTIGSTVRANPQGGTTNMNSRSTTNHMKFEYHSHGPAGIQKEEIASVIKKAMRRGELG
jgi:hypothetical protein